MCFVEMNTFSVLSAHGKFKETTQGVMPMKNYIVSSFFCMLLIVIVTACGNEEVPSPGTRSKNLKTVIMAEFLQETNSFSPVLTTERNFRAGRLVYGEEILGISREAKLELGGFLKAIDDHGDNRIRVVPVVKARSMSGGPVERKFYEHVKKTILEAVKGQKKVDGIYLSMHGAMGVEGMRDPEGDLLEALRLVVGREVPIGVSFDLHANVTKKRARLADFIVGYKTNPHRDHFDTGYRAGEILAGAVLGKVKPVMTVNKMRLLIGGGMNIDFLSPFRQIFSRMDKMEKEKGVLCVSFFPVHIWLDDPELGYTTVAVTDGNKDLAQKLADEIADMAWAARDVKHPATSTPEEGIEIARGKWLAREFGTVVFCDASDAVGTGTPGENTWILRALVQKGSDLVSYLTMRDEEAAREAWTHEVGTEVKLMVGGKLDRVYNKPLDYEGTIIFKKETSFGKTVIVKHGGIHLVIAELPIASDQTSHFTDLGLSLWKADIVVVKNLFPFRYRYLLYNRKTVNVGTPGISNIDVFALRYRNIPRPIYPLDRIDSWR
jgi:microcystin degradation protein MlrC